MTKEDLERDIEEAARSGNYKYLVLRKQEWMSVHLREISYFLEPLLPSVVNSGSLFCVEDLKPCPESDTHSDRLHVFSRIDPDTGEPAIKFVEDSRGACVPLTRIRTSAVRSIYEKMMEFVYKSDLPVYNPESHTGFWSSFTIRVNSVGKSMLVIEVYWLDPQEKSLKPELLNNLREYLQKSEENLLTVVLKLHSVNSVKNSILYGICLLSENINNLEFTIYTSRYCSWNLAGEEGFCENLINLSKMEKHSWGLIQIGCLSTVSTITLAAACSHSVAFNIDGEVRDFIISDAKKNSVNLQIVAECTIASLNGALMQRLSHAENICVVMFDVRTQLKDGDLVDILRSCSKVNRILFAARFEDPALLRRLVLCCSDHGGDSESFIVTRAVPVNLSPFNSNQIIIFVLERRSIIGNTLPNSMYNKDRVTEFLWGKKCKYIDAPYKDDDRYFALIPEKTLLQSIFEMLQNGRPKSALEYEEQLKLKQECVWLQGQAVTALLWGVLPKIIKNGTAGFYFPLKALKAPKFENTLSFTLGAKPVKSENDPKKWIMKYGLIDDNDEITVPLKEIHSPWAKFMYEKTMKFIEDYGYPLYNTDNKSGFWKLFKIKVNPEGLIMVVIGVEVDPEPQEDAEAVISELELALNYSFRDDNLRSLILKVYLGETIQYKIVAGIEFMHEEVPPFKMFNYYGNMPWMNSYGALEIARVVVDMIAVDSTWSVVQFGRTHDAMSLYIAKCCQVLHVVHDDKETKRCLTSNCQLNLTNQLIMYHENRKGKDFMDIIQYNSSNVCCVIPDFSYYKKNVDVNFLKNMPNVKKIICISKLTDPIFINEIVSLCDGVQNENEAFIIKEVVPVDTSPHDNVIKTVTLLVRQSLVEREVGSNPVFRKNDLQEFYSKSISKKHTFLTEVCNLIKPCISNNPTRFKFFQSLNLYSIHKDVTSVARGKSQMTTNEQIKEYRNSVAKEIEETIKKQDFETLVSEQVLLMNIIGMLQRGGPASVKEYKMQIKWKHDLLWLYGKAFCCLLRELIPCMTKTRIQTPGFLFPMKPLKPCVLKETVCSLLYVDCTVCKDEDTTPFSMRFGHNHDQNGGFTVPLKEIHSPGISYIYELMVRFIEQSGYELYNPATDTGVWINFKIRLNSKAKALLHIFVKPRLELIDLLKEYFKPHEDLFESLVLKFLENESGLEKEVIIMGKECLTEYIDGFKLNLCEPMSWFDPNGILQLSKTVIDLSCVDHTWTGIQLGSKYDLGYSIAKNCGELHVLCKTERMKNLIWNNAKQNKITNIRPYTMVASLINFTRDSDKVCLFIPDTTLLQTTANLDVLIAKPNIKKIVCISKFTDPLLVNLVVTLCNSENGFLLKEAIPVDMSPHDNCVNVVLLLVRKSFKAYKAEGNKDFSVMELRKYSIMSTSQKHTLIASKIDNLTRSFAEFQDEKRQFDRCLSFDWTTYESDKQTLIKEVEEAGNPSVMEVVLDEVNDDVKGDPGCDQEDNSDKQTLIKEIEAGNPSVMEVVHHEVTDDVNGDAGCDQEGKISTDQVNENNPSSSELQLLSLIADKGLVLPDNIAEEIEKVLSSQGIKTPKLDKKLVPVKTLNEDIVSMIHTGGPKTIEEYHKQLRWKHECTWLQAKAFCSIIARSLPRLVKLRTQGFLFNINGVKACPFRKTVSEALCVKSEVSRNDPDELVMRHRLSKENDTVLPVKSIYSEKVAELYNKMMVVIKSSGYPLHHPKKNTGYWKHFTIRVNSVGNSMLIVTVMSPSQNVGTQTIVSHIKLLLKMNFATSDVDSLVLEIISGFEYTPIVLHGELHLPEIVGNIEVKLCPHALWSNPYGILEVCRAIVNMASLDDTWAVIQLGQGYDVVHLYVAKHCGILHMQSLPMYRKHVLDNAKANLIKNITYSEDLTDILKSKELSSYSNICVIIPEFIDFDEYAVCLIKNEPKIKKIICVSEFTDPLFIDRIVSSCYDDQNSEKSFVIKDVTPVDMSPWDNLVKIVALLTRKYLVNVDHNQEFSEEESKELLSMTDTIKQHRLNQISDLIEPFVATHDEKSLYDQTLEFPRVSDYYNKHKDSSDENILKYIVSKYVKSNKFYSEIEKILTSDKPKTCDLYKNILSQKEAVATSLVGSLCDRLKPFQQFLFTGEKKNFCVVENLRPCSVIPTLSERIYVPLVKMNLNPESSACSSVYSDLYRRCQTDPGRRTFDLLMQFIQKSEYHIYNPSIGTGFWNNFIIRTDSTGNVYIVIVVQHRPSDHKTVYAQAFVSLLKQHLVDTRCPDYNVVSINLRVMERLSLKSEAGFGSLMATEVIDDFHLKFNFENILTYNRYGIKNLCNAIVELAELDKRWQVLQVGTECGIDVFHLAEKCNWVHYAERDKKFGIDIMADENGAKNITVWTLQNDRNKLQEILKNDFEDQKNICVVEYFTKDFEAPLNKENDEFLPSAALRKCTNVKKIIYVSELSNSSWESKLKICCLLKEDWEDPFVIKKFLTIDMSPFDNHIMLVCLLTRDTKFGVKSNPDYSPSKVRMFMDELIKDGYLVVRMKHKNIKSSALPLPPQRRDKGHNTHNTKKNEIDGEKGESFRISGETTKIPHVLRLKRSKSPVTDELHDSKVPRLNSSERIATTYSHIFGSLGSGAKQDQQRLIKPLKFSLENTSKAVRARQYKRTSVDTTNKNTTTSSDLNQNKIFFMETCFKTSEQCKQIATDTNFNTPIGISSSEQYIQYPTQALGVGGIQQYQQTPITSSFNVPTTVSSSEIQRQTAMNASYDIPMANGSSQQYNLHRTGTAFTALSRVDCVEQYKQMPSMVSFNIPTTTLNIPSTISSSKQMLPEGIIINLTESSTAINKEYVSLKTLPLRETVVSMSQNHKPETLSVGGNMLRRSRFDTMPVKNNHTKSNTFEKFSAKEILQGSTHGGKETLPDQETTIEESQYDTLKGVSVASNTGRKSRFDVHFKGSTAKRDIFEEVPIKKTMEKDAAHNVVKRYSLKEASLKSSALDDTERLPVEENTGNKSTYYEHFKESTKKINTFEEVPSKNTMEKEVAHNVVKRDRLKEASLKSSPRDDTERLRKEKNVKKSRYDEYFKASTAKSDTFQEMPIRKTMEKEAVHNVKSYTLKEASLKSAFHDDTERLPNEKNVKKSRYSEFFKASTAKSDTFEEVPVKITMKKEATHNVVKTQPIKEASLKNSTHDDTERLPVGRNVVQNSRVDGPFKETTAKRDIFEEVPIKKTMEKEATHNVAKRYSLKEATLKSSAHDKIGGNVEGKSKFAVHSKGRTAKNDMFEEVAIQNTMKKEAAHNVVKRCPLKEASLKDSVYDDNERLRYENSLLKSLLGLLFEETAAKSNTLEAAPVKKAEEYSQKILKEYSVEESAVQSSEYYIPQSLTLGKNNLQNSRIDRPFEANNKIKMEFLKNKSVAKESRCNVLTKRSPVMESVARSSRLNVSNETKYGLEDNSVKSLSQNSSDDMFQRGLFIENMAPIAKEHVLKRGVVEKIAQSNEYGSPARNLSEQSKRPSNFEYATTSSCERDLLYVGEERNRMKLVHEFGITEGVPEQVPEKLTLWRRGLHKTTQ